MRDRYHRGALGRRDESVDDPRLRLPPARKTRPVDGRDARPDALRGDTEVVSAEPTDLHRLREGARRGLARRREHAPSLRDALAAGEHMARPQLAQILEDDEVGATSRRDEAEILAAQSARGVEGRRLQRPFGFQAIADEAPHDIVEAAFLQKFVGIDVVGAERHRLRQEVQLVQFRDEFRQQMVMRAAQLDRHAGVEFFSQVRPGRELVIGRDAGDKKSLQIGAGQAARMSAHEFS